MSYDIDLCDPVTKDVLIVSFPHNIAGGTYKLGGDDRLHLNITYNYSKYFYREIDSEKGIRFIYGKTGAESIPILEKAISKLGNDVSENYWDATEGNAKRALYGLLVFASLRPDGVWNGD